MAGRAAAPEPLPAAPCLGVLISKMGPWRRAAAACSLQTAPGFTHRPAVMVILFTYKNVCIFN